MVIGLFFLISIILAILIASLIVYKKREFFRERRWIKTIALFGIIFIIWVIIFLYLGLVTI